MTGMQKILGLFALALALAFFLLQGGWQGEARAERLLPELESQLGQVSRVVIAAGETATLVRQEAGWVVAEEHEYPLDFGKLEALLTGLATAELVERKTARPELQGQLGLAAEGAGEARGKAISIYLADAETPAFALLLGKAAPARRGAYVRRAGEPGAWLVSKAVTAPASPADWLAPVAINVDAMQVQKVELGAGGDAPLVAERSSEEGGTGMALQGLPEGAALRYPTIADNLARALVNVRFEDVAPYDEAAWQGAAEARFTLANGEALTALTRQEGEAFWLHLRGAPSALWQSAWQYQISSYAFDQLNKTLADMLEEEAAEEE